MEMTFSVLTKVFLLISIELPKNLETPRQTPLSLQIFCLLGLQSVDINENP